MFAQIPSKFQAKMTESNKGLPISLKGITSTNDDPARCAICSELFPKGPYHAVSILYGCCGKRVCDGCIAKFGILYRGTCVKCGTDRAAVNSLIKKNAKKGQAWAQETIGRHFYHGILGNSSSTQSYYDAIRLFRKAANSGHPAAMILLGEMYANGDGCEQDLALARTNLERAIAADGMVADAARESLVHVAGLYRRMGEFETAISILSPLVAVDAKLARRNLAMTLSGTGNFPKALGIYNSMVKDGLLEDAIYSCGKAMACCVKVGNLPLSKFWLSVVTKNLRSALSDNHTGLLDAISLVRKTTRNARDRCGGCGAELYGKMRRKCSGCTAFCYCNRDCQKLHWNCKKDGHREECKEVMELKRKMKEVRKAKDKTTEK